MANIFDQVNLGGYDLRTKITSFLSSRVPAYIEMIREQRPEFTPELLPSPVYFDAYDPYTAKDYPSLGVYINGSDDYVMEDITVTGSQSFTSVYDITIYVGVRTAFLGTDEDGVQIWEQPERDSAIRIRDIYMAALKSIFFNEPSMGTAGKDIGLIRMQRATYKEIFPDPVTSQGVRFVAAGIIGLSVEHIETTTPPSLGYVHNIHTTIDLIDDSNPLVDPDDITPDPDD